MSTCRTFSERGRSGRGIFGGGALLLLLLLAFPHVARAQSLSAAEALKLAFPGATAVERRTAFLNEQQLSAVRQLAGRGVEVKQAVVTYYVGMRGSQPLGVAYFDAHRVRTLPEVLMVVVSPRSTIERVEVLKFSEPPEYRAPDGWLDQLDGQRLSADLSLKGSVRNITGATLTAGAVTDAARRVLALHQVIAPLAGNATR